MHKLAEETLRNLNRLGYKARYFETGKEAADELCASIRDKTVGFGGSVTADALKLPERLAEHNQIISHWLQPPAQARLDAMQTQVYICSVNALAKTGEMINIDGTGNRISATLFGHERMIFVVGVNKLTETAEEALFRARNVAAPLNARRLNRRTPCALSEPMNCHDCDSPDRICKGITTLLRPMGGNGSTEVYLIGEELGY